VGVGAVDPAALPAAVGVGVALGAALVAIAAAVGDGDVGDGDGPAAEPHEEIRVAPAARIANQLAPNRIPIVVPPASVAEKYA
jgi:hypothetical protein